MKKGWAPEQTLLAMQYQSRFRGCLDPVTVKATIDIALDYNYMPSITNKCMQIF